jgi:predicted metal-dependent phosphoesterase TrpH
MTGDGRFRVDPHVKVLDDRVVARAKAAGLDALVYAPHFTALPTVERRAAAHTDDDLLVVPGRELFTGSWRSRRHVLALGLDEPVPDFLDLDASMAELDRQDAAVLVPHPEFLTLSLDAADIQRHADVIDAVEAYNVKGWPWDDRRALAVARESDLPAFTSSYAHLRRTVGAAWIEFEERYESGPALVEALRRGVPRRLYHESGLGHALECRAEFVHLAWENSWDKFARVALPGQTPTHPDAPVYGGRFDDASVY